MVDVNYKSKGCIDDPFVLASQAHQVYYAPYPSMTKDLIDWWAVVKTKPRGIYEIAECVNEEARNENVVVEDFFQENDRLTYTITNENDELVCLVRGEIEEVDNDVENTNFDDEEVEFEESEEDSDKDNELILSDHSSDDE